MKVIMIGGSAASMSVAARLRRKSPTVEIVVYQREKYVSFGACGLPYYIGEQFSDYRKMLVRTVEDFAALGIKVHLESPVTNVDFDKKEITFQTKQGLKKTDTYDQLFIGVGASPIIPAIPGIESQNVFSLTRLEDAWELKKILPNQQKIAIIGSGFIGLEICEALGMQGRYQLHLIEAQNRVMARALDPEFSHLIADELKKKQVDLIVDDCLTEIQTDSQKAVAIKLRSGKTIPVDMVILTLGFKPATEFLKDSGLAMTTNGALIVNRLGQTNIPGVWSCGDCATSWNRLTQTDGYLALATVARKFARVVAENILGQKQKYAGNLGTAMVKTFDLECARTGLTEAQAQALNKEYESVFITDKDFSNYLPGQRPLYLKLLMDLKTHQLLGAQMAGENKSILRIDTLIALIWNASKVDDQLEQLDLPYAPPFSRPVDIINIGLAKLLEKIRKA